MELPLGEEDFRGRNLTYFGKRSLRGIRREYVSLSIHQGKKTISWEGGGGKNSTGEKGTLKKSFWGYLEEGRMLRRKRGKRIKYHHNQEPTITGPQGGENAREVIWGVWRRNSRDHKIKL